MLSRITSVVQLVCLLVSSLAAAAWAEPPATVPTRVIRELDGRYTIETRPTSDRLHAGISADVPPFVSVYSRTLEGAIRLGTEIVCNGTNTCAWHADVRLTSTGWQLGDAFLLSSTNGFNAISKPWTLTELHVTTMQYLVEYAPDALLQRRLENPNPMPEGFGRVQLNAPAGTPQAVLDAVLEESGALTYDRLPVGPHLDGDVDALQLASGQQQNSGPLHQPRRRRPTARSGLQGPAIIR